MVMAGNRIKKKRKVRWFPLLICLIVMFNAIVIYRILTNLWDYLEEYEAAQPTGTIERYMEELKNGDYSKLMKYTEYVTDEFNSEEDFGEYMAKFLGDTSELTYTKTSTKPDGTINYAIYSENTKNTDDARNLYSKLNSKYLIENNITKINPIPKA